MLAIGVKVDNFYKSAGFPRVLLILKWIFGSTMDYLSFSNFSYGDTDEYAHEPHTMPVPSGGPWNVQGLPWGSPSPPQLVQFNAQVSQQPRFSSIMHCKRKSLDPEPPIPAKIYITEDKMADHLNGLHLSSDYRTHHLASNNNDSMSMDSAFMDMDGPSTSEVRDKLKGHTIVLAEEIKKLKDEPLIPPALMERLEKPCMSLVVWQPKESVVDKLKGDSSENRTEEEPKKRNGVLVPDMSMNFNMGMDVEM